MSDSTRISPTAHYTGHTWYRQGWSHPALATWQGRALHHLLSPFNRVASTITGGLALDTMLVERHVVIDHLMEEAIRAGCQQVVEIASGLSPRGIRCTQRHASEDVTYVEADLPDMAERKRRLLVRAGISTARHHVVALDILAESGPLSLASAILPKLDESKTILIITEGLLNYFDTASVEGIWNRIALMSRKFPRGAYVSDLHLKIDVKHIAVARLFKRMIDIFARGATHLIPGDAAAVEASLCRAGFSGAQVNSPRDFATVLSAPWGRGPQVVRIVRAWTE